MWRSTGHTDASLSSHHEGRLMKLYHKLENPVWSMCEIKAYTGDYFSHQYCGCCVFLTMKSWSEKNRSKQDHWVQVGKIMAGWLERYNLYTSIKIYNRILFCCCVKKLKLKWKMVQTGSSIYMLEISLDPPFIFFWWWKGNTEDHPDWEWKQAAVRATVKPQNHTIKHWWYLQDLG